MVVCEYLSCYLGGVALLVFYPDRVDDFLVFPGIRMLALLILATLTVCINKRGKFL